MRVVEHQQPVHPYQRHFAHLDCLLRFGEVGVKTMSSKGSIWPILETCSENQPTQAVVKFFRDGIIQEIRIYITLQQTLSCHQHRLRTFLMRRTLIAKQKRKSR